MKFPVKKSTVAFIRAARKTSNFGIIDLAHGYLYARWPYFWVSIGTGRNRLIRIMNNPMNVITNALMRFPADRPWIDENGLHPGSKRHGFFSRRDSFADIYHGKVMRFEAARQLVAVNKCIRLKNLEKVIPYATARDLVIESPNRILALACPCRVVHPNPCLPLHVCLVMGDLFINFVAEHHAERSSLIDRSEAMDILIAEAERGHVHHAFFKEAAFGRFFAICNCCSCCCGAMQAYRNGIPMLASSGYVSVVNKDKCETCGICVTKCPFEAIQLEDTHLQIDAHACMGCGVCQQFCSQGALSLKRNDHRSDPLELDQLLGAFGEH